ncbi:TetR/AcrR family transcriptional regulator [Anaeromyxobacter diazotrophicus]|uniref:TetR/AcrR family transcriptional regulator n=1 Tax=Anaeromyxobacter diazotrophicus TaxID=2590199 RepID=UPI001F295FBB|nr:TetR/AcrR family transcriptional regulator [Anaeromyxobacter diazotrophicus]
MDAFVAGKMTPGAKPSIADRLWEASRAEFSLRGYHGARVQGIARRAGCNVALLYRHWASKRALYLEVLRTIWSAMLGNVVQLIETGRGAPAVVGAYLDANLRDPLGAQIIIREFLDGGPFLNELFEAEPELVAPVRRAVQAISGEAAPGAPALRPGLDPTLVVLSVGGLAALVASAHEAARPFFAQPVPAEVWRQHLYDLLLHGVLGCQDQPAGGPPPAA